MAEEGVKELILVAQETTLYGIDLYGKKSLHILLNELNREGVLKKGQKLVLAGFGAGLSWGASVLDWDITE